jgi:hypothetical protein
MFRWMAYNPITAPTYWAAYTGASVRHAAWGMSWEEHRRLMRFYYGL